MSRDGRRRGRRKNASGVARLHDKASELKVKSGRGLACESPPRRQDNLSLDEDRRRRARLGGACAYWCSAGSPNA